MDKLQRFYKSKAWEEFRRVVIAQRTSDDGIVRCAVCGAPIVNKYDLVVHHRQELSAANVDDALIALNPDNVECVHFKCHNRLHDRWQGGNNGHRPKGKRVVIVWGAPCSGKSTWVAEHASANDIVVDIDNIYQALEPTGARWVKSAGAKALAFRVRDDLYDAVKHRAGKWSTAYVVAGAATVGDRERLKQRVNADELVHVPCDKDECLRRLELREMPADERERWRGYIDDWFGAFQQ